MKEISITGFIIITFMLLFFCSATELYSIESDFSGKIYFAFLLETYPTDTILCNILCFDTDSTYIDYMIEIDDTNLGDYTVNSTKDTLSLINYRDLITYNHDDYSCNCEDGITFPFKYKIVDGQTLITLSGYTIYYIPEFVGMAKLIKCFTRQNSDNIFNNIYDLLLANQDILRKYLQIDLDNKNSKM